MYVLGSITNPGISDRRLTEREFSAARTEISGRSDVITGYRSILRVAHKWDVHTLTIPLLLMPNQTDVSGSPVLSDNAMQKRAELVLKSTKGLIMEHSRLTKHAGDSSGVERHARTLVFVLPRSVGVGTKMEDVYGVVRERLAEVFRTS